MSFVRCVFAEVVMMLRGWRVGVVNRERHKDNLLEREFESTSLLYLQN